MPNAYIDDFSGGCSDRSPSTLDPNEQELIRNCYSRGGVLRPAPGWERQGAVVPGGYHVVHAVGRPDRTSVLVLASASDNRVAILSADGNTVSPPTIIDGWGGTREVDATWTPRGTVVVAAGQWPVVVLPDNTIVTLDSLDVRTRGTDEYRVGVTNEVNLFKKTKDSPQTDDFDSEEDEDLTFTAVTEYVSIASTGTFNEVVLKLDDVTGVSATLHFVDDEAEPDSDTLTFEVVTNADNERVLMAKRDWTPELMAQTSSKAYRDRGTNERDGSTIGVGQVRAFIKLVGQVGKKLKAVELRHTQYVREVLLNKQPHLVELHHNRVMLAFNDTFLQFGAYNRLNGWEQRQEYFTTGGDRIKALKTHAGFLAVFMDHAIHAVTGNSDRTWGQAILVDYTGTKTQGSVESDLGYLFFADRTNRIAMLSGEDVRQVGRHCRDTLTKARGGGIWATHILEEDTLLLLPHGGPATEPTAFMVDPEALRQDRSGGWKVSFFAIDLPGGPVAASWTTVDRRPMVVVGGTIYRMDDSPTTVPNMSCRLPLYVGGDPTGNRVRRIVLRVKIEAVSATDDITMTYLREGLPIPPVTVSAAEINRKGGVVRRSVPIFLNVASVLVESRRRPLLSVTMEYFPRYPGGVTY